MKASNPGHNYETINSWYQEMSSYFKSIDKNHMLTTGEMGYDVSSENYSNISLLYNDSYFLFNGSKGTSYSRNIQIPGIDYSSFHLYSGAWNISYPAGITWIQDHIRIAEKFNKPALLSEFGSKGNRNTAYEDWLNIISTSKTSSALVWEYQHSDVINNDGFGFDNNDTALIKVFEDFQKNISKPVQINLPDEVMLYQNYPNPFNPVTTIKFEIPENDYVELTLYNSIGQKIGVILNAYLEKGIHQVTLSFNNYRLGSGVYIYALKSGGRVEVKKMILLK